MDGRSVGRLFGVPLSVCLSPRPLGGCSAAPVPLYRRRRCWLWYWRRIANVSEALVSDLNRSPRASLAQPPSSDAGQSLQATGGPYVTQCYVMVEWHEQDSKTIIRLAVLLQILQCYEHVLAYYLHLNEVELLQCALSLSLAIFFLQQPNVTRN